MHTRVLKCKIKVVSSFRKSITDLDPGIFF